MGILNGDAKSPSLKDKVRNQAIETERKAKELERKIEADIEKEKVEGVKKEGRRLNK